MKSDKDKILFTVRQQAAILRLYVQKRLPTPETASRLRLSSDDVVRFLRERGLLRRRGRPPGIPMKISPAARRNLEGELATTRDAVLARKYGLSNERIRQIRQELGYPSSRILHRAMTIRARAKREEQEKLALELQRRRRRAKRLLVINRLSKRWKSGVLMAKLAQEYGYKRASMNSHICSLRREFPEKFPYRQ